MKISILLSITLVTIIVTIQQINALPVTEITAKAKETKAPIRKIDNNAIDPTTTSIIENTKAVTPTSVVPKIVTTNTPLVGTTTDTPLVGTTKTPLVGTTSTSASPPIPTSNPADDQLIANSMFTITYTCDFANKITCGQVERSINKAGGILTKSLNLKSKVNVNAAFSKVCKQCGDQYGVGAVANTVKLVDDDGVERLYPSALVKQFGCAKAPKLGGADITLTINNGIGIGKFHLEGDQAPIKPDQQDIEALALRELVHGLGLRSSWSTQAQFAKTVPPTLTPTFTLPKVGNQVQFSGFVDSAFDKHIFTDKSLRDYVKQLNSFSGGLGAKFVNEAEFVAKFIASDQGKIAQSLAKALTTSKSTTFLDKENVLDTTSTPFKSSVSLDFFDQGTFGKSEDFLMTNTLGATLDQLITAGGGNGPIGPKLLKLLSTMGYPIDANSFKVCPGDFTLANPIVSTAPTTPTTQTPTTAPATNIASDTNTTPVTNKVPVTNPTVPTSKSKPANDVDPTPTPDQKTTPTPNATDKINETSTPTQTPTASTTSTIVNKVTRTVPIVTTQTITNGDDVEELITSTVGSTESVQLVTEVKVIPLKNDPTETDEFPDSASNISLNSGLMIFFTIISLIMGIINF